MADKKLKIAEIRKFVDHFVVGNIVVGTHEQLKFRRGESDYWYNIYSEEEITKLKDINELVEYGSDYVLTPEGQRMLDEHNAKKSKKNEEDDD